MTMRYSVHIALQLFLFVFSSIVHAQSPAFLAGVLRSDGIIVPFACYDGSGWETPWPEADAFPDTAFAALDSLPKAWYAPLTSLPLEWYVRTASGEFRAVTVERPAGVVLRGSLAVGLRTGIVPRPERPSTALLPRKQASELSPEGIAFSRNTGAQIATAVGRESAEWARLVSAIRRKFEEAETKRGHPLAPEIRTQEELQVISLFRGEAGPDGSTVYFFETIRSYVAGGLLPVTSPAGCARFRGWILRDRTGTPAFIDHEFTLERFSVPVEPTLTPIGTLPVGGRMYWLVRERDRGSETYMVLEAGRDGLRKHASTFAGGN